MSLSSENSEPSIWKKVQSWFGSRRGQGGEDAHGTEADADLLNPCCTPIVHIAYRGKSDDKMYIAYNRKWQEVRFFQPNGLRVFCSECRRRVY